MKNDKPIGMLRLLVPRKGCPLTIVDRAVLSVVYQLRWYEIPTSLAKIADTLPIHRYGGARAAANRLCNLGCISKVDEGYVIATIPPGWFGGDDPSNFWRMRMPLPTQRCRWSLQQVVAYWTLYDLAERYGLNRQTYAGLGGLLNISDRQARRLAGTLPLTIDGRKWKVRPTPADWWRESLERKAKKKAESRPGEPSSFAGLRRELSAYADYYKSIDVGLASALESFRRGGYSDRQIDRIVNHLMTRLYKLELVGWIGASFTNFVETTQREHVKNGRTGPALALLLWKMDNDPKWRQC